MAKKVILAFIGDVMLGRLVAREIGRRPDDAFWGTALPVLRAADTVFANLECAITQQADPWTRTPKAFHFRAGPGAINILQAARVSCVSLANNHVLDFETEGLIDTLQYLDSAGIAHAGAGRTLDEASSPAKLEANGLKISFTSLTDNEPSFSAAARQPGTFYFDPERRETWEGCLSAAAARAREGNPDLSILSAHLGPNMIDAPSHLFRDFTDAVIVHGFDIFVGHSAHLFQGVRTLNGGLILHDMGDFLNDYAVDPDLRNDWSFIFLVEVEAACIHRLRMIPVTLRMARVDIAEGDVADAICERMILRCKALGTSLQRSEEGLCLDLMAEGC